MIYGYEYGGESGGQRELLNEVHGDGVPQLLRDGKLF